MSLNVMPPDIKLKDGSKDQNLRRAMARVRQRGVVRRGIMMVVMMMRREIA